MLSLCWTYIEWSFNGNSQSRHITTSSIYVTRMGESKGYCFITFANIESANAAPWDGLPIWGCWWMLGCWQWLCNVVVLDMSRLDRLIDFEIFFVLGVTVTVEWKDMVWRLGDLTIGEVLANYESNTVEGKWVDCKPPSWLGRTDEHHPHFAPVKKNPALAQGKAGVVPRQVCLGKGKSFWIGKSEGCWWHSHGMSYLSLGTCDMLMYVHSCSCMFTIQSEHLKLYTNCAICSIQRSQRLFAPAPHMLNCQICHTWNSCHPKPWNLELGPSKRFCPRIGHAPIAVTTFLLGARNATAVAAHLLVPQVLTHR